MKYLLLVVLLSSCTINAEEKQKTIKYCLVNNPTIKCEKLYGGYNVSLDGCESGNQHNFKIYGATNVMECE